MGVTEGDLHIDIDVILGNCTLPFVIRIPHIGQLMS